MGNCFDCDKRHGTKCELRHGTKCELNLDFSIIIKSRGIEDLKNWGLKCIDYKGRVTFIFR